MIIVFIKFVLPAVLLIFLLGKMLSKDNRKSKSALVLLLISLVFNTALAQNYNYSLIPYPGRDGFSVSNALAYYVFGEDHFGHWNSAIFEIGYEISIYITILLVFIYIGSLIYESREKGDK